MQMYISQLSYLCDKLIKGGSKKIKMVGFGLNGSICQIFKLLLKTGNMPEGLKKLDKLIEVVTFNSMNIKRLVDLESLDLTKSKNIKSDIEFYSRATAIIKGNIEKIALAQVTIGISLFVMKGAIITLNVPMLALGVVIGAMIEIMVLLEQYLDYKSIKDFLKILEVNGYIKNKESENKGIKGYLTNKILQATFKETILKLEDKELELKTQLNTEDIIFILKYKVEFPEIKVIIEKNTEGTYVIVFEKIMVRGSESLSLKETFTFKNGDGIFELEEKVRDNKFAKELFKEREKSIKILEDLKIIKGLQDSYIKLFGNKEIKNYYLGRYKKTKEVETLGKNKTLGVSEPKEAVNENLFYPFIKIDGEFGEVVREEYVVSALRSHTENYIGEIDEKPNKKFIIPVETIITEAEDKELNSMTNSKKDILKTIVDRFKMLEKFDGFYTKEVEIKSLDDRLINNSTILIELKGQYFLYKNIISAIETKYKDSLEKYIDVKTTQSKGIVSISVNGGEYDPKELEYSYLTNSRGEEDLIRTGVYRVNQKSTDKQQEKKGDDPGIEIVVESAVLKCSRGEGNVSLKPNFLQNCKEKGKLIATVVDGVAIKNIPAFPKCNVEGTNGNCSIQTSGQWEKGAGHLPINGVDVLCSCGELTCKIGGKITIVFSGGNTKISER
jgi:hypothetical protein